jgi:hypothetical protein
MARIKLSTQGRASYDSIMGALDFEYFEQLTPWQREFISSCREQLEHYNALSKKQMDQIDNIASRFGLHGRDK